MKLPPRKYLKDRKLGDETFSDFAQGYDQALDDVEQLNTTEANQGIPRCPVCNENMHDAHRYYAPAMGKTPQLLSMQWVCNQSDEKGNGHSVMLRQRPPPVV